MVIMTLGLSLNSCYNSPAENKKAAENDVKKSNEALEKANQEYLEDIAEYRSDVKIQIAHNDSLIKKHKETLAENGLSSDPYFMEQIENMENQNKELQDKMDNYKGEGKDNWTIFKEEYDHDMEELGKAIKDLVIKNT